ncbi:MAG: hypothetical protein GY836_14885, partial [Herbaspirillum sp.]|uniref:hypothetical protein n=1 Tax=Herbaspirillum sp. TaxID=1890675 RepID=UPI0025855839
HTAGTHAVFHIDLTGPPLHATQPADDAVLTSGVATYGGNSDPDLATALVNGRPATVSSGSFTLSPFPWQEGENRVTIELTDGAGHRGVYTRSFTVRSLAPTVEIVENGLPIADDQLFLRPVTPEIRVSDPEAALVATLNGAPYTPGTDIAATGDHTLTATATDDLERSATATAHFRIDIEDGPTIEITSPVHGTVVAGPTVDVSGTVSGRSPAVEVNEVAATVSGTSWTVIDLPLAAGDGNDLVAVARDDAGRTAVHRITVMA